MGIQDNIKTIKDAANQAGTTAWRTYRVPIILGAALALALVILGFKLFG